MKKIQAPLGEELIGVENSRFAIPTPALLLDLDALEKNIAQAAGQAREKQMLLRPHCKGHKSINIAKLQVAAGAVGISCATLGEAEIMASAGISGVLITSPVVFPSKISRLITLNQASDDLMVVVDHPDNVKALAKANEKNSKQLKVLIDFDIGQNRTGVKTFEEAASLIDAIKNRSSLTLAGLQAYGGHLQHIKNYSERRKAMGEQKDNIKKLRDLVQAHTSSPAIVTGGGTGTFQIDLNENIYTELQPGSYVFMDVQYLDVSLKENSSSPFLCSLFVLSSVVSAHPSFAIVDAGLKSFATDGPNPALHTEMPVQIPYQFMGDEHGKLTFPHQSRFFQLGDAVEFIVPHCDPTVNLYDFYHCLRKNTLVDIWPVDARGFH